MESVLNVFKVFKPDSHDVSLTGNISKIHDTTIGKRAFKITGLSAKNYIQIPSRKSKMKSLGVSGQFLYVNLKIP